MFLVFLMNSKSIFPDSNTMIDVDNLIKYGFEVNKPEIKKKSTGLTSNEKIHLMEKYKTSAWGGALLNIFLGFGIGSYVQGDMNGGNIGTICDILSYGTIIVSYQGSITPDWVKVGTVVIFFGSRIFQVIIANVFADKRNAELSNALFGGEKVTFLFAPFQRTPNFSMKDESGAIALLEYKF